VGDEVAVMLDGRVVQQSLPADLYTCPATRAVADFIGDANLLGGTAHGRVATTSIGSVPLRESAHGSVDVMIRPEQMSVHTGRGATIEQLDYYGHDAVYHVLADDGSRVRVRVIDTPKYRPGDVVEVRFDGEPTAAFAPADT
jgi:iron(III) transport system ATP-binding protein